jgi:hypothetical protein
MSPAEHWIYNVPPSASPRYEPTSKLYTGFALSVKVTTAPHGFEHRRGLYLSISKDTLMFSASYDMILIYYLILYIKHIHNANKKRCLETSS